MEPLIRARVLSPQPGSRGPKAGHRSVKPARGAHSRFDSCREHHSICVEERRMSVRRSGLLTCPGRPAGGSSTLPSSARPSGNCARDRGSRLFKEAECDGACRSPKPRGLGSTPGASAMTRWSSSEDVRLQSGISRVRVPPASHGPVVKWHHGSPARSKPGFDSPLVHHSCPRGETHIASGFEPEGPGWIPGGGTRSLSSNGKDGSLLNSI